MDLRNFYVSEDFIGVIKSRMIGGEMKTTYVILVGILVALITRLILLLFLFTRQIIRCCNAENRNTKEKLQFGRPKFRWDDNI
jgi:hypothetical protein